MAKGALSRHEFTRLIGGLCRLHHIAFAPELLLQHFPPDADGTWPRHALFDAADRFGLVAAPVDLAVVTPTTLGELRFPLIALPDNLDVTASPLLLLHAEGEQIRCLAAGAEPPELPRLLAPADIRQRCGTQAWTFAPKPQPLQDIDSAGAGATTPFGFSWFIPELLRHRKVWRDILGASLALQLVGLLTPLLTQVVIDRVVVHQTHSTLIAVGVGLALALLFSAAFTWVRQYLVLHTGNRIDAVLGSRVLGHLLRLPMGYFAQRPTGTLVARLHGIETIREFISGAAVSLILDLPFMTLLLAVMFWYSWQLSLIALGLLALLCLLSLLVTPLFRERLDRQFLLGARNQAFVTEYVAGMETVKSLQMEPQLDKRYGGYLAGYLAAGFDTRNLANGYTTVANALEQMQSLAVLVVGALLVMNNDGFTIGMLVAFQMFASRLSQPMLRLVGLYQEFQQANLAVKRLGDLMDAPAEPHALQPTRTAGADGRIELHGVSFRYSEQHPWLFRHLDLAFRPGKTTLLTGPSGCGKSTLARLLLGFHRPDDGRILLDGQDIRNLAANELRQGFGVVPQETVLFAGTVFENLHMANPLADFADIIAACKQAEIHDTIEQLPKGYQTELGEHGVGLSGGQKQRIAIARALLKQPKVLIFDEATANLDAATAEQFARTINQLKGKVTTLFIAHQVPQGLLVDEVVKMGATESGTEATGEGDGKNEE